MGGVVVVVVVVFVVVVVVVVFSERSATSQTQNLPEVMGTSVVAGGMRFFALEYSHVRFGGSATFFVFLVSSFSSVSLLFPVEGGVVFVVVVDVAVAAVAGAVELELVVKLVAVYGGT